MIVNLLFRCCLYAYVVNFLLSNGSHVSFLYLNGSALLDKSIFHTEHTCIASEMRESACGESSIGANGPLHGASAAVHAVAVVAVVAGRGPLAGGTGWWHREVAPRGEYNRIGSLDGQE